MRTYEKRFSSSKPGPHYTGIIAVTCLFVSMLVSWAIMRTSPDGTASSIVTLAQHSKAP